jgi:hypothetical protein
MRRREVVALLGGGSLAPQRACAVARSFDALKAHYPHRAHDRLRVWMAFPDGLIQTAKFPNYAGIPHALS